MEVAENLLIIFRGFLPKPSHDSQGAGGEISDFQYLGDLLDEMADEEACDAKAFLAYRSTENDPEDSAPGCEDWLHEDGCSTGAGLCPSTSFAAVHKPCCPLGPKEYSSYIGRVMYNRRSKSLGGILSTCAAVLCCSTVVHLSRFNPLYNQFIVVGKKQARSNCILHTQSAPPPQGSGSALDVRGSSRILVV